MGKFYTPQVKKVKKPNGISIKNVSLERRLRHDNSRSAEKSKL